MDAKALKRAKELEEEIGRLEDFMFWCSGKRKGLREYPVAIVKLKRKWLGGVKSTEYDLPERLQKCVSECVEEELKLLKKELEEL